MSNKGHVRGVVYKKLGENVKLKPWERWGPDGSVRKGSGKAGNAQHQKILVH
jgi:hypothetical protein